MSIINQTEVNLGWIDNTSLMKASNVYDNITCNDFPLHFYWGLSTNVVGVSKSKDEYFIKKYFSTSTESVRLAKALSPALLDLYFADGVSEILLDVTTNKMLKSEDFREVFPKKEDPHTIGLSDRSQKVYLMVGGSSMGGVIATLNYSSMFYAKPAESIFSLASKKFFYCWVCKTFGFEYNSGMSLDGINFPSIVSDTPLYEYPKKENLTYLTQLSKSIMEETDLVEAAGIESLSGILIYGGIDEEMIELSRHIDVIIEIDNEHYKEDIYGAVLTKGRLEVTYNAYPKKAGIMNTFLAALAWRGPTSYMSTTRS